LKKLIILVCLGIWIKIFFHINKFFIFFLKYTYTHNMSVQYYIYNSRYHYDDGWVGDVQTKLTDNWGFTVVYRYSIISIYWYSIGLLQQINYIDNDFIFIGTSFSLIHIKMQLYTALFFYIYYILYSLLY